MDTTELLTMYLNQNWPENSFDYHFHSEKGCYFLSSIFALSNESWQLVQGEYDYPYQEKHYYHSWLEKGNVIFDPAMRVVTLKSLYDEFFLPKYHYNKETLIPLFQRTGVFTYYEEDLKTGCVNLIGQLCYYDTKEAKIAADAVLEQLELFLKNKSK